MAFHPARQTVAEPAPASFCVLGMAESVHWVSLALMRAVRAQGFRTTGLMPVARDAQWRHGRWHSARVARLQAASSFDFPASALCTAPVPDPAVTAAPPRFDPEAVAESYAALATWTDVVVVDGVGDPDAALAPGFTLADLAQSLGLPVIVVCEDDAAALQASCALVKRCRARGLRVAGWVQVGQCPQACAAGIPRLGVLPRDDLQQPGVAACHVDAARLIEALGPATP